MPRFDFARTVEFFDTAVAAGDLEDGLILIPLLKGSAVAERTIGAYPGLRVLERTRRTDRDQVFFGSPPRQRLAMEIISGGVDPTSATGDARLRELSELYTHAAELHTPTRGAMLLTFAADAGVGTRPENLPDPVAPSDVATLFSLAFPKKATPTGRIGFKARITGGGAIIPRGSAAPTD